VVVVVVIIVIVDDVEVNDKDIDVAITGVDDFGIGDLFLIDNIVK
jgi:hypothetical protein